MKLTSKKSVLLISIVILTVIAISIFAYERSGKPIPNLLTKLEFVPGLATIPLDNRKTISENFLDVVTQKRDVVCTFSGQSKGSDESGPGTMS